MSTVNWKKKCQMWINYVLGLTRFNARSLRSRRLRLRSESFQLVVRRFIAAGSCSHRPMNRATTAGTPSTKPQGTPIGVQY